MSPEEFRKHGHSLVDWIADYQNTVETYPVFSRLAPGEIRSALPLLPPKEGEPCERIMSDVDRVIMPGITHWQSPNFFAFFPSNNSGPSVLGELLSAGLGVQGLGQQLWEHARAECLSRGNRGPFTVFSTPNAVGFYERCGFAISGGLQTRNGLPAVPMKLGMTRRLPQSARRITCSPW